MKYIQLIALFFALLFNWSCRQDGKNMNSDITDKNIIINTKSIDNNFVYQNNIKQYPPPFLTNEEILKLDARSKSILLNESLNLYTRFLETNDETIKSDFLNKANKLNAEIISQDGFSLVKLNSDKNITSIVNQSLAIVILSKAFALTHDHTYSENIKFLVKAFGTSVNNKGFQSSLHHQPFYTDNFENAEKTLINHNYALLALYYAKKAIDDQNAKNYFEQGLKALEIGLKDFDGDFTSLYHLGLTKDKQYAFSSAMGEDPDFNHELLIKQLIQLFAITNNPVLKRYAHLFLKQDMGSFSFLSKRSKFLHINSTHSVDEKNLGVKHLDDELWSWGKYWSTNQFPTDLIIEFPDEKQKIEAITFISIKKNTAPKDFRIYTKKNGNWTLATNSENIKKTHQNYYLTGNYESFIETLYLPEGTNGTAMKIEFLNSYESNIVALREINVLYDRSMELELLYNKIKEEMNYLLAKGN